jgi:NADH:ubiquinone oxidoreductase subunit 3 (subunit A)
MLVLQEGRTFRALVFYVIASFLVVVTLTPALKARAAGSGDSRPVEAGNFQSGTQALDTNRSNDLATVQQALERKKVRERLRELGFTEEEVQQRLRRFSDQDLNKMAERVRALKVGGVEDADPDPMRWVIAERAMLLVIFSPMAAIMFPLLIVYYFLFAVGPKRK